VAPHPQKKSLSFENTITKTKQRDFVQIARHFSMPRTPKAIEKQNKAKQKKTIRWNTARTFAALRGGGRSDGIQTIAKERLLSFEGGE